MLPTRYETQKFCAPKDEATVQPGNWWRLTDARDPLLERPLPDHGLVQMVSEVRAVDDKMHTIVLHPHRLWKGLYFKTGP
jgi:hypothetical protein